MNDCLFCKIVTGTLPCQKIFEDDNVMVFNDIHPVAPVHFLIVPKLHIASLAECDTSHGSLLADMLLLAPRLARQKGLDNGFRTMINTGPGGGQEIFHLHVHVFGGGPLKHL